MTTAKRAIVCEGGFACRCNLAVRRRGSAREYLVYGLDVYADLPEAKALLDGLLSAAAGGKRVLKPLELTRLK